MKTKGLNFLEAVATMKEGKKVKRDDWGNIRLDETPGMHYVAVFRVDEAKQFRQICLDDIEATDWEIVEEKKEILCPDCGEGFDCGGEYKCGCEEEEIPEHIKKTLLKRIENIRDGKVYTTEEVRGKIFGKKKKTPSLSDKEFCGDLSGGFVGIKGYYRDDLKAALKEFIDWIIDYDGENLKNYDFKGIVKGGAKEIFGSRLMGEEPLEDD